MFDFHLHLARLAYPAAVAKGLKNAEIGFNSIACEPWEWENSIELGEITAFGVHPMAASKVTAADWSRLDVLLRENGIAQVGECGLDKRYEGYEIGGIQDRALLRQMKLAESLERPLHIHCVGDYMRIVKMMEGKRIGKVIFHRFGGDTSLVKFAQRFNPIFSLHRDSFKKKSTLEAIKQMSPEQIRFETDADERFVEESAMDAEGIVKKIQDELENVQRMYERLKDTPA